MKLIIDIPEEDYEFIKGYDDVTLSKINQDLYKSVSNGIPLNDKTSGETFVEFAEFVAEEIFSEEWEFNKDSFSEIACRKLYKLGVIDKNDDEWVYKK